MKRPVGVVVSAVVLALISLGYVLFVLLLVLADILASLFRHGGVHPGAATAPLPPTSIVAAMYAFYGLLVVLAVWGILTTVGLFRLRRWARTSVLIIGGGMAVLSPFSMLGTLAEMALPHHAPPGISGPLAQTLDKTIAVDDRIIVVLFGLMMAVGISWLVYFNLKQVREVFADKPHAINRSRRPLLIAVIAVLILLSVPGSLLDAHQTTPAVALGFILHGWGKTVFYLAYATLGTASGIGLWRMKEWGRRLALCVWGYGAVSRAILLLRPSIELRFNSEVRQSMHLTQPQLPSHLYLIFHAGISCLWFLLILALAAILHYYRGEFGPSPELPKIEPPQIDPPQAEPSPQP